MQYLEFLKSSKVESHDLSEEKRKEKEELRLKIEKEFEEKQKKKALFIERASSYWKNSYGLEERKRAYKAWI